MAKQSVPLRIIGVCLLPTGSVPGASLNATQKQMLSFPNTPAAAPNGKLRRFRELRRFRRFDPRRGPLQTSAAALPRASSRRCRGRSQERLGFHRGLSPRNPFHSAAPLLFRSTARISRPSDFAPRAIALKSPISRTMPVSRSICLNIQFPPLIPFLLPMFTNRPSCV